jgi:hypothetical protein
MLHTRNKFHDMPNELTDTTHNYLDIVTRMLQQKWLDGKPAAVNSIDMRLLTANDLS